MRGSNVNELQPFRLPLHGMVFLGDQARAWATISPLSSVSLAASFCIVERKTIHFHCSSGIVSSLHHYHPSFCSVPSHCSLVRRGFCCLDSIIEREKGGSKKQSVFFSAASPFRHSRCHRFEAVSPLLASRSSASPQTCNQPDSS